MLTAVLLVCTTLISNGSDETVATKSCQFEQQPAAAAATNSFDKLSFRMLNDVVDTVAVVALEPNPANHDVKPTLLKAQQNHRVSTVANLAHRVVHANFGKAHIIPTADISLPTHKLLSFWDKLKQEPASNFKPIVTD